MKRVNHKRRRKRQAANFGTQADLCRRLPCCACEPWWYRDEFQVAIAIDTAELSDVRVSDPAHVPGRKMGGTGSDDSQTAPLSNRCGHHREYDSGKHGRAAFVERYGIDPREVAQLLREELERRRLAVSEVGHG